MKSNAAFFTLAVATVGCLTFTTVPATGQGLATQAHVLTDFQLNPIQMCSGSQTMRLPALGQCPSGSIGIAACTRVYDVPLQMELESRIPLSFTCTLNYAEKEPAGNLECDYSRCLTIGQPGGFDVIFDGVFISDWIWAP